MTISITLSSLLSRREIHNAIFFSNSVPIYLLLSLLARIILLLPLHITAPSYHINAITAPSYHITAPSYHITALSYHNTARSYHITARSYNITARSYNITARSYNIPVLSYQFSRMSPSSLVLLMTFSLVWIALEWGTKI